MKSLRDAVTKRRQSIPWSIGKLRELPAELIEEYLNHCEAMFKKTLFNKSKDSHTLNNLADLFSSLEILNNQPKETIEVNSLAEEESKMSEYLLEECKLAQRAVAKKNVGKKVIFPHATEYFRHYKHVFSDLCKDPLPYESQYLFITFGKYLSEPINQLVRAVNMYESAILK
eukprot:TRINITY_DN8947_c0_g1_i11.p1 TRINITY_DN8947_c0_g1~~TRINITY_DN8947_c0_g1_i11.p1  ORF type:complete len:172 (+),score=43.29 TRINITY_DN8947_c0_g1_i11:216-731(+)